MTSEAIRNGNKQHVEIFLLFSNEGTPSKRAGVRTPWTPPRSAPESISDRILKIDQFFG